MTHTHPDTVLAQQIGYECCEHLRRRGITYTDAVADPLIARLLRRTGEAYLASRAASAPDTPQRDPLDDPRGMAWWNALSPAERWASVQEIRNA